MYPLVGANRVRPARGTSFLIDLQAIQFGRADVFRVSSPSLEVIQEPNPRNINVNIPLGRPFSVGPHGCERLFSHDLYVLQPVEEFRFVTPGECRSLTVGLMPKAATDYAATIGVEHGDATEPANHHLHWQQQESQSLIQCVAKVWRHENARGEKALSPLYASELEDEIMYHLSLAVLRDGSHSSVLASDCGSLSIDRAEQYLCAHLDRSISRVELADVASTSIRSLSRGFKRRWGMGPMEFLKNRRLDAVFCVLLGAEKGEITVSEVASRFGFSQLGAFAGQYRMAFGELPSETLRR